MTHHIARRDRKRHVAGLFRLIVAAAQGLVLDLDVDIARGAGHVARAHGLATGGLHRLIEFARHVALRGIAGVGSGIMVAAVQRQGVGGATGQQNLISGHPAADLRQAHRVTRKP